MSQKLAEALAVVATLDPVTVVNTEVFTDAVDMGAVDQILAIAQLGNMASETIDFRAYSCDSNGSSAVLLAGRAATQLAAHASNNDGVQLLINVRNEDLLASGKQHVKFGIVTGGATGGPAAIVVLGSPRQGVGSANDLASVSQIVG